jgi:CheY-like chemotaxis protein
VDPGSPPATASLRRTVQSSVVTPGGVVNALNLRSHPHGSQRGPEGSHDAQRRKDRDGDRRRRRYAALAVELLESWELVILSARDAEAALRMLREGCEPEVILLDLMMPGMSGWEFRRALMNNSSFARIPVVVMTALLVEPESAKERIGDVIWLPKPFRPEALADAITRARSTTES